MLHVHVYPVTALQTNRPLSPRSLTYMGPHGPHASLDAADGCISQRRAIEPSMEAPFLTLLEALGEGYAPRQALTAAVFRTSHCGSTS